MSGQAVSRVHRPDVAECLRAEIAREKDAAWFFRGHRRQPLASLVLMAPISRRFVAGLERYAQRHEIEVVQFRAGERKDEVMAEPLAHRAERVLTGRTAAASGEDIIVAPDRVLLLPGSPSPHPTTASGAPCPPPSALPGSPTPALHA